MTRPTSTHSCQGPVFVEVQTGVVSPHHSPIRKEFRYDGPKLRVEEVNDGCIGLENLGVTLFLSESLWSHFVVGVPQHSLL